MAVLLLVDLALVGRDLGSDVGASGRICCRGRLGGATGILSAP